MKHVCFFCVEVRRKPLQLLMHVWLGFSNWSELSVHESHHASRMGVSFLLKSFSTNFFGAKILLWCVGHKSKSGMSLEINLFFFVFQLFSRKNFVSFIIRLFWSDKSYDVLTNLEMLQFLSFLNRDDSNWNSVSCSETSFSSSSCFDSVHFTSSDNSIFPVF